MTQLELQHLRSVSFGYKNVPSDIYFNAAAEAWNRRMKDDGERSNR